MLLEIVGTPAPHDGIPALEADLDYPADVAADGRGNVYVADASGGRVRRIDTEGLIDTVA